jgi:hypothetical protein
MTRRGRGIDHLRRQLFVRLAGARLGLAYAQTLREHVLQHGQPRGLGARHQDRSGVALGDRALRQRVLNGRRQVQQPQGIGHRHAAFTQPLCQLVLREAMLVDELAESDRFLQRVQVAPLDVLDQGHLQAGLRGDLLDDGR